MENKVLIDREEYDKLILTAYAFDFLKDSLLINARLYGADHTNLYFNDEKINDILKVMCQNEYDARFAELKAELKGDN